MMSALNTQTMSAYTIGVAAPDEPWQQERSQPQIEKQFERQSMVPDQEKRKQLIWEIDKQLQEDQARPSSGTTVSRPAGSRGGRG